MKILKFYATWCGPCRRLSPVVDKLAEITKIEVEAIDIDQWPGKAQAYGVQSVPTIILVDETGHEIKRVVGVKPLAALQETLGL
jgi:thioredoxin